jgi:hypothetical protein
MVEICAYNSSSSYEELKEFITKMEKMTTVYENPLKEAGLNTLLLAIRDQLKVRSQLWVNKL